MHGLGPGTHTQVERKDGFHKNCKEGFAQISETFRPSFSLSWVFEPSKKQENMRASVVFEFITVE